MKKGYLSNMVTYQHGCIVNKECNFLLGLQTAGNLFTSRQEELAWTNPGEEKSTSSDARGCLGAFFFNQLGPNIQTNKSNTKTSVVM